MHRSEMIMHPVSNDCKLALNQSYPKQKLGYTVGLQQKTSLHLVIIIVCPGSPTDTTILRDTLHPISSGMQKLTTCTAKISLGLMLSGQNLLRHLNSGFLER